MASYVLYPPIVDGYMPSFVAGNSSYCRVYFSLSKFKFLKKENASLNVYSL